MSKSRFYALLVFYAAAVLYLAATTPISPHEAKLFYTADNFTARIMHTGYAMIDSVFGLRIFFVAVAFASVFLFYLLAKEYLKLEKDVRIATIIFAYLPGFVTASVLANHEIVVLFAVLLFVFLYRKGYRYVLPLVMLALFFIHDTAVIFYIALLFYTFVRKERFLAVFSAAFIVASLLLSKGIEIGGHPSGHFIEIFGLYATIFSPLLFLYFFYAMYRILLRGEKTLVWYLSFTALIVSLLLSLRQKVDVTDFAPYVLIATVVMVDLFNKSYRIRLPKFRRPYKIAFATVLFFMFATDLAIFFSGLLYRFTDSKSAHFAARIYEPYEKAQRLKTRHIPCYDSYGREYYQLRFYGIEACRSK